MEEWKDPQTRAEEEDRRRGYSALEVDDGTDTREKLEADVYDGFRALDELEQVRDIWRSRVHGWLDRQAAITERDVNVKNNANWARWCKELGIECTAERAGEQFRQMDRHIRELTAECDEQQRSAGKLEAELRDVKEHADRQRVRISELEMLHIGMKAQRDALQEKVDELELRERCASDYDYRQASERWEEAYEDKCAEMCLTEEERDELKTKYETCVFAYKQADAERKRYSEQIDELFAERDRLLEQLNRVWLKDADGNPLHIGETRYGEDGTGWRVTGFRWGSSHPVQGVDGEGRRRDLKPEWLRSERPDGLVALLEDVRRGALAYPRDRITGYLEDNHSIGEAVLLDVRDRIEKLAGGSE